MAEKEKDKTMATKSLIAAVEKGDVTSAKKYLHMGGDASWEEKGKGQTLIHMAIQSKNYFFEVVEELVKNGAKLNELAVSSSWLGASGSVTIIFSDFFSDQYIGNGRQKISDVEEFCFSSTVIKKWR